LGKDNAYLEKLLIDKLDGVTHTKKRIPLSKLVGKVNRHQIRTVLEQDINESQKKVSRHLHKSHGCTDIDNLSPIAASDISTWVLNTVLHEKLKEREVRESADYWKYINGILALVLPIVTGVVQYYITKGSDTCGCESN
jgi:hypothetical protein